MYRLNQIFELLIIKQYACEKHTRKKVSADMDLKFTILKKIAT